MKDENRSDGILIDFGGDKNNLDGNIPAPPGPGFAAYPQPPQLPIMPHPPGNIPFNYPQGPGPYPGPSNNSGGGSASFSNMPSAPFNYNIPPNPGMPQLPSQNSNFVPYPSHPEKKDLNVNFLNVSTLYPQLLHERTVTSSLLIACRNFPQQEKKHESLPPPYSSLDSSTTSPDDNAQVCNYQRTINYFSSSNIFMHIFHSLP
jgi:hypothetical protein